MQNTNKPRTKNSARENIDLFVQKILEARLIGYQDNTPTHINDLITEKAKGQKNLDMGLSGFIRSKDNSDVASKITKSSFVITTEEFHFCKLYISLALFTSSFFFSLIFAFFYLIKVINLSLFFVSQKDASLIVNLIPLENI